MGGGESTAERYAKFGRGEYSSEDFEKYVDSRPDLAAAWGKIESDPSAWDSKYWIDKGATSKAAFGRAHAAEDAELYAGTYGDAGDTKVLPGTPEYEAYFGDGGGTYFDSFISGASEEGGGGGGGSSYRAANPFFPQLVQEYEAPGLLDWSAYMPEGGLFGNEQYQPWTNPNAIPENVFYYQPPMINYSPGAGFSRGGSYTGGYGGGHSGSDGGYMGSESVAPLGEPSGKYDSSTLIPGTNTSVQSLFDYESGPAESLIYDQDNNIESRYYVPPDMRQDLVAQDIQRAKEDAYIKANQPVNVPINVGRINPLTPEDVVAWTRIPNGSAWVQDQLNQEINRVANEIAFRPRSREEAQYGADPNAFGITPGEQGYGQFSGQAAAEAAMGLDPFGGQDHPGEGGNHPGWI